MNSFLSIGIYILQNKWVLHEKMLFKKHGKKTIKKHLHSSLSHSIVNVVLCTTCTKVSHQVDMLQVECNNRYCTRLTKISYTHHCPYPIQKEMKG